MLKRTLLFLLLIGAYILVINVVASIPEINFKTSNFSVQGSSGFAKADFGHSVEVTVERKRFYGSIVEQDKISNLYVLKFIKIPLKYNNFNFKRIHQIFFGITSIFYLIVLFSVMKSKKRERRENEIQKDSFSNGDYIRYANDDSLSRARNSHSRNNSFDLSTD